MNQSRVKFTIKKSIKIRDWCCNPLNIEYEHTGALNYVATNFQNKVLYVGLGLKIQKNCQDARQ